MRNSADAKYSGHIRLNAPLYRNVLFAALLLTAASTSAILWVIAPYSSAGVRAAVGGICVASAAVALAALYRFSRSFSARVSRLKNQAQGLLQQRIPSPASDSNDALGTLEQALGDVAVRVHELLDRGRYESARREVILSSMAEGVLAVDKELRVIFCNDALALAVGARRPVPERLPLLQLIRDSGLQETLSQVVSSGADTKRNLRIQAARGRTFEVQAAPLDTPAGRGAVAILHDITELERVEQIRKDFVANVSHELRTPLANIVGCSDTLLDGALNDAAISRQFIEIIRANAIRLNSIASDLLVLSELESAADSAELETIPVLHALQTALTTVAGEAQARNIRLAAEDVDPDVCVAGHKFRLEQALLNLISNAVRFNRPGGEVRVSVRRTADGQAAITVADTGVGIPSQDVPRIFERFYRVDKARSREVGGTGLGLSITKHVVERMSGRILVESQLGKGSTFTVVLPIAEEAASQRQLTSP